MATRQTVVAGTTITASWGNNVMDGIVNTFASSGARASAITAPSESMLTYLSDLNRFEGYDGQAYAPLPFSSAVVKTADEQVSNSITFQDDDHLVLPLAANAVYELSMTLYYVAVTSGSLKFGFTYPLGASLTCGVDGYLIGGSFTMIRQANYAAASGAALLAVEGAGGSTTVNATATGTLTVGSTAGSLRLQWAQNTSNAIATTVRAGSVMRLTRIS